MKPVMLYGLMISVFLCFGSCRNTDEEFQPDDALPPIPDGYVRMQITVPGLTPASTYALNGDDETKISEVDVLVFKDDANDTYLCHAEGHSIAGAGNTKTFDVFLNTADRIPNAYVMVIANAHQAVNTVVSSFSPSTTKEDVMKLLEFGSADRWNVPKPPATSLTPFPMWGMTASPVSLVDTNIIQDPVTMIRSVAKTDVEVKVAATVFALEEVRLYNTLDKGSVAPYSGKYDFTNKKVTAVSIPGSVTSGTSAPGVNAPVSYLRGATDGFSNNLSCANVIYMAEQSAEPAVNGGGSSNRPCLIIGGRYNGSPDVTYYRLDFVTGTYPTQTFLPVLRNHRYRFDITEVKGPGYDTPEEAFDAVPFNMTVSLSAMNESLVTSYVYNGQYALGTSHDTYTLDNRQHTDTLYLSTTYGSYSATASSNGDWLKFGSIPGSGNISIPVTTVSNTPVMLTFNITENDTGLQRDGTITITSGLLKKEITVTQKSSVNGFSVTAQGSIGSPFSARITSSTAIRVTSTYNWRVRVDSDPDAIISSFTPVSGGAVTNQAITLTLKPNADWTAPTAEATLTFFSPAGEFQAVERKVSLAARTYETDPSTHLGWAGSNIYWVTTDASTGAGYLTFDDTPTDRPADDAPGSGSETYQGVFFKWGGLVGLDSSGGWGSGSKVYVPDFATGTWTQKTAGTAGSPSSPTAYFSAWSNIPYVTYYNSSVSSYITTTAHTPETWRGDICRYLSETGKAPGSPVVMWRMPTSGDFSGALNDYGGLQTWPGNLSSGANDGTWPVMYDGSFIGRRKKNNPRPDANGYKPFFSAGGFRWDNGSLDRVGNKGHYHSASRGANSSAYLVFYTDSAGPYTNGQAYGGIIRCVKAS